MKKTLCVAVMAMSLFLVSCVYVTKQIDENTVNPVTKQSVSKTSETEPEIICEFPADDAETYKDVIACVMVNGELYYDTGRASTVKYRCGVMDGNIDSDIGSNRLPEKNNQSNFGTGYGYQYGPREGTIEVLLGDEWCVFATQAVIEEITSEPLDSSFNDNTILVSQNTVCEIGKGTMNTAVEISAEDALAINQIIKDGVWDESGTTDCNSNVSINLGGFLYYYHSDCGTVNCLDLSVLSVYDHAVLPEDLGKSLVLSQADKEKVNGILEKYISLSSAVSESFK